MKHLIVLAIATLLSGIPVLCAQAAQFTDNDDGTVTDAETGLIWQQGERKKDIWKVADAYCKKLDLAGHNDWHLPTEDELKTLIDPSKESPATDKNFFPNVRSSGYWTSTSYPEEEGGIVYFRNGYIDHGDKLHEYYIRCVRTAK